MRCTIFIGNDKLELEDLSLPYSVSEGMRIVVEKNTTRTQCIIKKIDRILVQSGNNLDAVFEIHLEEI